MAEQLILFSAPMVRAIRAGTKTQTRRILKSSTEHKGPYNPAYLKLHQKSEGWKGICPYGKIGDRVRVKEAAWMWCEKKPNGATKRNRQKWLYVPMREAPVFYCADRDDKPTISITSPETGNEWGWRKKIGRFLPAWAVRTVLELNDIRIEPLQEISIEDCHAEGAISEEWKEWREDVEAIGKPEGSTIENERDVYRQIWEAINGAGAWELNPWVWALGFKVVTL